MSCHNSRIELPQLKNHQIHNSTDNSANSTNSNLLGFVTSPQGRRFSATFARKSSSRSTFSRPVQEERRTVETRKLTGAIGTLMWMAPEMLEGIKYGPEVDVYSYAIVMWEIAAQDMPWQDLSNAEMFSSTMLQMLEAGRRPQVDESWPTAFTEIMTKAWQAEPSDRGTFEEITQLLLQHLKQQYRYEDEEQEFVHVCVDTSERLLKDLL